MGRKLKSALTLVLAIILAAACALPAMASSQGAKGSMKVVFLDEGTPVKGITYKAYRISGGSELGKINLEGDFAKYGTSLNGQMSNSEWRAAAHNLLDFVKTNGVLPDAQGTTDEAGTIIFPNLEKGIYLVDGNVVTIERNTYTPQPFWVKVEEGDESYAEPKFDRKTEPKPDEDVTYGNLKITKIVSGEDADQKEKFPFRVSLSGTYSGDDGTQDAGSIKGKYGDLKFENGTAEFTLKHGESVMAESLPTGISYEVIELDPKEYTPSYEGATGVIPINASAYVIVTNSKGSGSASTPSPTPEETQPTPTPSEQNPNKPTPGGDDPNGQTPGGDNPNGQTPGGVTPGGTTQNPTETPGADDPNQGNNNNNNNNQGNNGSSNQGNNNGGNNGSYNGSSNQGGNNGSSNTPTAQDWENNNAKGNIDTGDNSMPGFLIVLILLCEAAILIVSHRTLNRPSGKKGSR